MKSTTVLLDLDNTLLGNPMHKFLPAYFTALKPRLLPFIKGQNLQQLMYASAQTVQINQDPEMTNLDVFMADFAKRIGHPLAELQSVLDTFYEQDYPQLEQYTTCYPAAREIVTCLLKADYKVVIATNPLFPASAIEQRLAWAGVGDFPYALVTTMDNSHFLKPNPGYYQEILTKIESTPETSWMVGDDLENDITPAYQLGLKTWWIRDDVVNEADAAAYYDKQGTLVDFLSWVKKG